MSQPGKPLTGARRQEVQPAVKWDILGIGVVTVDDLLYVERFPEPGTKSSVLQEIRQGGGLTGTALVAAARLGASTAYMGVLDEDNLSTSALDSFAAEGVDCSPTIRVPGARPVHARIIVDRSTGQRTILSSLVHLVPPSPDMIEPEAVGDCRVLFIDHWAGPGGIRAASLARSFGIPVVGDIERSPGPWTEALIAGIDHLIVGVAFAGLYTGCDKPDEAVRALMTPPRMCCVVTDGENGCWYATGAEDVRHVPAYTVPVVDSTGCGDVFHGAYAACLARGLPVRDAIAVASATAAIKATQPGGRAGIPRWPQVLEFLRDHGTTLENEPGATI